MQTTVGRLLDPFAEAALQVLSSELGVAGDCAGDWEQAANATCSGVAVLVGMTGQVKGTVVLDMPLETALAFAGIMIGEALAELDEIGKSAVAELGNMIAGRATVGLEALGCQANITPPTVVTGAGTRIATVGTEPCSHSLSTSHGEITVTVAMREEMCGQKKPSTC